MSYYWRVRRGLEKGQGDYVVSWAGEVHDFTPRRRRGHRFNQWADAEAVARICEGRVVCVRVNRKVSWNKDVVA